MSNSTEVNCLFHELCKITKIGDIKEDTPESSFPFRVQLIAGDLPTTFPKDTIVLPIGVANLAVESLGRIEPYFNSYVIMEIFRAACLASNSSFEELLNKKPDLQIFSNLTKDLIKVQANLSSNVFNKEKYMK